MNPLYKFYTECSGKTDDSMWKFETIFEKIKFGNLSAIHKFEILYSGLITGINKITED